MVGSSCQWSLFKLDMSIKPFVLPRVVNAFCQHDAIRGGFA